MLGGFGVAELLICSIGLLVVGFGLGIIIWQIRKDRNRW